MNDRYYLDRAMQEAEHAYKDGTYPVGAVIVDPTGEVIGLGHNHVYSEEEKKRDFTSHAEVEAIRDAGKLLMKEANSNQCTLYTTMEPCLMCSGAILLARIKRVVWVLDDEFHGALRHLRDNMHPLSHYYSDKIADLEFLSFGEQELVQQMSGWMETWNSKKEDRVRQLMKGGDREEQLVK